MEIKNKKIVITGGLGFIGSNLAERLIKNNEAVVVDNFHTGSPQNLRGYFKNKKLNVVRLDVKDIEKLRFSPDIIFHLGIYSSTPMYKADHQKVSEAIAGAISVFNFAVAHHAKVVFASSSSIYNGLKPPHREDMAPKVTDFYTEARIAIERLAELYNKLYGVDITAERFFSVYGRHEESKKRYANLVTQFVWAIKEGEKPVIYGDGSQSRDFTYVDDVVDALMKATKVSGFNIFNVGTGKSYTLNELISKLEKHTGKRIQVRYVKNPLKNYVTETRAYTAKAESLLGFKAHTSLDDGIKNLLHYYGIREASTAL